MKETDQKIEITNNEEDEKEERIQLPSRRISVRNLVEFILREGDIVEGKGSARTDVDAMQAGAKLHRKLQAKGGSRYASEVALSVTLDVVCAHLTIEGRADGVITGDLPYKEMPLEIAEDMKVWEQSAHSFATIDEIKCMYRDVYHYEKPDNVHLAQAKCYAYMYARAHQCEQMVVQVTYVQIESEHIKRFWYHFTYAELEEWFYHVVFEYTKFLKFELDHLKEFIDSARACTFPFEYRKGQRELTAMIYSSMKRKENLFCQAPTGVGKTISSVFPAVKAVGEGLAEKIFYLTAKTITRTVAEESFTMLRERGLNLHSVTISAKDKLCILEERNCNPIVCERARGHYDRVNECLYELLTNENNITRDCIEEYAQAYKVCPYELSLDVSLWVDAVICDYNYVFDPKVKLKRFFSESGGMGEYLFLVDESHNLVERARNMYSAYISKEKVLKIKRLLQPVSKKAAGAAGRLNDELLTLKHQYEEQANQDYLELEGCDDFCIKALRFVAEMEKMLEDVSNFEGYDEVMEFYFEIHHFLNMYEDMDENYVIYVEPEGANELVLHLFCVNPSHRLKSAMDCARSTIFFSATLLPVNYYKELLTGNQKDNAVYIPSPFDAKNRLLAITSGVTSKYSMRGYDQYERIVEYLRQCIKKPGNYMVFFSSYKMMEEVYDVAVERGLGDHRRMLIQTSHMTEVQREQFLREFQLKDERPLIAFCILGGIFSEGIDLKEDQLIGAFIVGNGLPQVCTERKILQEHFSKQHLDGFAYAYIYPGMNKVLQAAGRVIRTDTDQGVILLMDDRFRYPEYRSLFPQEWNDVKNVTLQSVSQEIKKFWLEKKSDDA